MYSSHKITKADIIENIIEVERELENSNNLKDIAFLLQKKLEQKAQKLRMLEEQQIYEEGSYEYEYSHSPNTNSHMRASRSIYDQPRSNMQDYSENYDYNEHYQNDQDYQDDYEGEYGEGESEYQVSGELHNYIG